MQYNITTSLLVSLSESGFGFDELVYRMHELYTSKAFPSLLKIILELVDESLRMKIMSGSSLPEKCRCDCDHSDVILNGRAPRKIRTRLGVVELAGVTRARCRHCGKSFSPLMLLCGIEKHQTKTNELEKLVLEQCSKDSYRSAAANIHEMTASSESHSTFRRWVLRSNATELDVPMDAIGSMPGVIYADGTKCKAIDGDGHPCKGDVKVMLCVRNDGHVFPVGTWTHGEKWSAISAQLKDRKVSFPEGSILVCDGEAGLAEPLSSLVSYEQRCHWHVEHDTQQIMLRDGAGVKISRPIQRRLRGIMAIELPQDSYANVPEAQKRAIVDKVNESERKLDELIAEVRGKGYANVAVYLEHSKHAMFGYVRRWLSLGLVSPRASSFIERTMRALGKRIKKIGYNWKPNGVEKISRIILKIFADDTAWERYWAERMAMDRSVILNFKLLESC